MGEWPTRVLKVGGSLFDLSDLPHRVSDWLQRQPAALNILIAGGGALVEAIRLADRRFALPREKAHWLAVDILPVTAKLLHALLPQTLLVDRYQQLLAILQRASPREKIIFDCREFLLQCESKLPGECLTRDWRTTSDSIAARLACVLDAEELILLKSRLPPPGITRQQAADADYVDSFFPRASARSPRIVCVDLRSQDFAEVVLGP